MNLTLGVIGNPIIHSLSPLIHRGWLREFGIDGSYMALRVDDGYFPEAMTTLEESGYIGLNVTAPHKHAAHDFADHLSERAAAIGAVNTLTLKDGAWYGDNTDAPGVMAAMDAFMSGGVAGKSVVLIGAGGAARGVAYALDAGGANLKILNRTYEKAQALAVAFTMTEGHTAYPLEDLAEVCVTADLVINTTSAGYEAEPIKLGEGLLRPFYDITYGATAAPQIASAKDEGWLGYDGLSMLVHQAAFSFEIWTGKKPNVSGAIDRCLDALKMAKVAAS